MSSLFDAILGHQATQAVLGGLGYAGNLVDTYSGASSLRDLLSGDNPWDQFLDPQNAEKRVTGRQILEKRGWAGDNTDQGWIPDAGDLGGFAAEMVLDPTNLIGGGLLARLLGKASKAKAANRGITAANELSQQQRAMGFMPEEVAKLTKIVDETGAPKRMLHGTPESGIGVRDLDPQHAGKQTGNKGFIGHGISFTDDPYTANQFTKPYNKYGHDQNSGTVLMAFIDSRNPRYTTAWEPDRFLREIEHETGVALRPTGELIPEQVNWIGSEKTNDGLLGYIANQGPVDATRHMKELGYDSSIRSARGMNPGEMSVFDPSQVYLPYIAKQLQELQRVASPNSLLMSLAGTNAVHRHRSRND